MPHVSSPIAYPCSSSPPSLIGSLAESGKRGSGELQNYPSKKRRNSGYEFRKSPDVTPLGSHFLLKKAFDANKENFSPQNPPDRFIESNVGLRAPVLDGSDRGLSSKEAFREHQSSDHKDALSGFAKLRSGVTLVEVLPQAKTSSGEVLPIRLKQQARPASPNSLQMNVPVKGPGEAERYFFGIDVHSLLRQVGNLPEARNDNNIQEVLSERAPSSIATPLGTKVARQDHTVLWTEKYRARRFTDLIGDDRTHRDVLRWLKGWDSVVFPGSSKPKALRKIQHDEQESNHQTKILMLTGSPGLGKTTLAHVCARQAGYEVLEINASDERSRDVVKGKIRDCVGTDNVKGVTIRSDDGKIRKKGRPFCVIVDEVDGVVSGGSSGEGGFIKALIDLVLLDRKNSNDVSGVKEGSSRPKKKGDRFRILRPIILICNDVYHSSLRPLRATTFAEIVHIRKPPLDKVVTRISSVFDKEGLSHDNDGVRRLCEAAWGLQNRGENSSQSSGTGEGDLRCILVAAEWVVSKLRQNKEKCPRLTKNWIEDNVFENLSQDGRRTRGVGRGNAREVVERVFQDSADFRTTQVNPPGFEFNDDRRAPQTAKRTAMQRLQAIVDTSGESDHIITDCFAAYPSQQIQDDTFLSKPNAAYEWLYFHDRISSKVHSGQEWELHGYLSQAILGLHHLFATPAKYFAGGNKHLRNGDADKMTLFMGPRADFEVSEVMKENNAILQSFQSSLSTTMIRGFGSATNMSTDLLPNVIKMLTPDVKPVMVSGNGAQRSIASVRKESERQMIQRAVGVMSAIGVNYQQSRVESGQIGVSNYIYRMEPPIDTLTIYQTASQTETAAPIRYAICQALDQEYRKFQIQRSSEIRQARYKAGRTNDAAKLEEDAQSEFRKAEDNIQSAKSEAPKRDFFGRVVKIPCLSLADKNGQDAESHHTLSKSEPAADHTLVWVTFNEGFSNAVRKPVTLREILQEF